MSQQAEFYSCGGCGAYHKAEWNGDCRQDDARWHLDELDAIYGWDGWYDITPPPPESQHG